MKHWQSWLSCVLIIGCGIEADLSVADAITPDAIVDGSTPDAADDAAVPDAAPGTAAPDAAPPDVDAPDAGHPDIALPPDLGVEDGGPACGPERCNGLDDDCDGRADEHFNLGAECSAGVGACAMPGQRACAPNGQVVCSAEPGPPAEEICDGIDNDCDAAVDEGVLNACGQCGAPPDEACDRVDNDCDGVVDEGVRNACGACAPPLADLCDRRDNDCDGAVDEDFVPEACVTGVGACAQPGMQQCVGGRIACGGAVLPPSPERCGDAIDNDCDGHTDEGQPNCAAAIGRCAVAVDPLCEDGEWACPAQPIDPPIPPECAVGAGNPPRAQVTAQQGAVWVLPPNADDASVAILWPENGVHIQRVSADATLLGDPAVAPLTLHAVTRAGADFAGIEADGVGYRWVRFNAAGEVLARAPHFFERTDEVLQREQLVGGDIVHGDGGGFVVAFAVWHEARMGFYVAHLDADGAVLIRRDVGAVSGAPRLFKTAASLIVATTTFNGVTWGGNQNGNLPSVARYGVVGRNGVSPVRLNAGMTRSPRAIAAGAGAYYFWAPARPVGGVCVSNGAVDRYCYARHASTATDVIWRGADGLVGWFDAAPDRLSGIRVQRIDAAGQVIDVKRWIATDIDQPRMLRMVPTADGVLVVWAEAGGVFVQAGVDAVDAGDAPLCPQGQRALPADGVCDGDAVCVDPAACVPAGPICGCDGKTYPDRCAAMARAVGVWRDGECPGDDFICEGGIYDIDHNNPRCRPCTAYVPACAWRGERREGGRIYADACAALAVDPMFNVDEGECRTPEPTGCDPFLCDNVCPVCGADDRCYGQADAWGDPDCF